MDAIEFFKSLGKEAYSLIRSTDNPTEVVGRNPLGQESMKVDVVLEDLVLDKLNENKIGNKLVTEEKGDIQLEGKKGVVVLDPLDGSNNFERKVPSYGMAISLAKGAEYKDITHSYIKDLCTGDEYWAVKDQGAYRNGKQIKTSSETDLKKCILEYDPNNWPAVYDRVLPLLKSVKDIRRFGANALALCYIASGAHHLFVDLDYRLSVIHAAGLKICEEAGAVVTSPDGNEINPPLKADSKLNFVCSANRTLHEKALKLIK